MSQCRAQRLTDLHPASDDIAADVRRGLGQRPKVLASKYLYDAAGSALFERICGLPEYYLTRTESAILAEHGPAIAAAVGPRALVVEYGSGSGIKTRQLLRSLHQPVAYVPIEISRSALLASVGALAADLPDIEMLPVCADFTQPVELPQPQRCGQRRLMFFPGSTLGNFATAEAVALLRQMADTMGEHGAALIGIDLQKSPELIEAAYNDSAGVTAAFTLNLLTRLNRELDADFELSRFAHRAVYNPLLGRIETDIVSGVEQIVRVAGHAVPLLAGEKIRVEISCKYTLEGFAQLAARAGLRLTRRWTDAQQWFALVLLERRSP
ncbi:MAG: L-histidine N(alpha)-methyltransferase [Lysobacterales bacterium]